MKITYLLTTADAKAGTERAIAAQTRAMVEAGHEVTVASVYRFAHSGFDFGPGVNVEYISSLDGPTDQSSLLIPAEWDDQYSLATDSLIVDYLGSHVADIVVSTTPALTVLALLACPPQVKIVQQEHRNSISRGVTGVPVLRHSPRVDALVVLTQRSAEWLAERWGSRAPRIEVIPNSLPDVARPQSSVSQHVVMGAGRFVGSKGFVNLVRAFARIADDFPQWRLRLFGDGPQREQILAMARNLGIAGQLELFPPTDDIEVEWSRASIGALASTNEGLPLVLLEARGAGLPLVAFDCDTGPREIIRHGKDGYLVEVGDISGFASALRLLMKDERTRARMSAAAPESLERFAPGQVAKQWMRLFEDLATESESVRQRRDRASIVRREDSSAQHETDMQPLTVDRRERAAPPQRAEKVGTDTGTSSDASVSVQYQSELNRVGAEEAISAAHMGADEDGGTDGIVVDYASGLLPRNARDENRRLLETSFAESSLRCRAVTRAGRTMWALRSADRFEFLQQLAARANDGLEVRLYAGRTRLDQDGFSWREDPNEVDFDDVTRVFLFYHFRLTGSKRHIGHAAGLSVYFWEEDEQRAGLFRATTINDEVELLRPEQFDQPLFAEWLPLLGNPLWNSVQFPIDAVYTWVDDSDRSWRERRAAATGDEEPVSLAGGDIRFRNREELKYSLRSIFANAPWVRNVYVVTDAQRPAWLEEHPRVTVVDHRDLFPDTSVLPVFNSHAIETVLHRIPGLAEHFLYLNDDVFLMREQRPEQYFTPSGCAKAFVSPTKINDLGIFAEPHELAGENNRSLVERDYGVTITNGMLHTPHPHRVSVLEKISECYSEAVEETRHARFRGRDDLSMLSSLGQYVGLATGAYVEGSLRVSFVSLGSPTMLRRLSEAGRRDIDCLTFGEFPEDPHPALTQEVASTFMRSSFPVAAPWERYSFLTVEDLEQDYGFAEGDL